jgi:hypothetical protein
MKGFHFLVVEVIFCCQLVEVNLWGCLVDWGSEI